MLFFFTDFSRLPPGKGTQFKKSLPPGLEKRGGLCRSQALQVKKADAFYKGYKKLDFSNLCLRLHNQDEQIIFGLKKTGLIQILKNITLKNRLMLNENCLFLVSLIKFFRVLDKSCGNMTTVH